MVYTSVEIAHEFKEKVHVFSERVSPPFAKFVLRSPTWAVAVLVDAISVGPSRGAVIKINGLRSQFENVFIYSVGEEFYYEYQSVFLDNISQKVNPRQPIESKRLRSGFSLRFGNFSIKFERGLAPVVAPPSPVKYRPVASDLEQEVSDPKRQRTSENTVQTASPIGIQPPVQPIALSPLLRRRVENAEQTFRAKYGEGARGLLGANAQPTENVSPVAASSLPSSLIAPNVGPTVASRTAVVEQEHAQQTQRALASQQQQPQNSGSSEVDADESEAKRKELEREQEEARVRREIAQEEVIRYTQRKREKWQKILQERQKQLSQQHLVNNGGSAESQRIPSEHEGQPGTVTPHQRDSDESVAQYAAQSDVDESQDRIESGPSEPSLSNDVQPSEPTHDNIGEVSSSRHASEPEVDDSPDAVEPEVVRELETNKPVQDEETTGSPSEQERIASGRVESDSAQAHTNDGNGSFSDILPSQIASIADDVKDSMLDLKRSLVAEMRESVVEEMAQFNNKLQTSLDSVCTEVGTLRSEVVKLQGSVADLEQYVHKSVDVLTKRVSRGVQLTTAATDSSAEQLSANIESAVMQISADVGRQLDSSNRLMNNSLASALRRMQNIFNCGHEGETADLGAEPAAESIPDSVAKPSGDLESQLLGSVRD